MHFVCLGVDYSRAQSELCEERLARGTTKDISLKTSPKRMDDDVNDEMKQMTNDLCSFEFLRKR